MDLPGVNGETLRLGFVDVPGHERFVRNMLAGVGGIDLVLLVIAADESIKPQTREHFDILQLLDVRRGITVLTKSDAVDPRCLIVADGGGYSRNCSRTLLEFSLFWRLVADRRGAGRLEEGDRFQSHGAPPRDRRAIARLPIDRVFTKGVIRDGQEFRGRGDFGHDTKGRGIGSLSLTAGENEGSGARRKSLTRAWRTADGPQYSGSQYRGPLSWNDVVASRNVRCNAPS